jgi:hypothetical protein
MHIVSRTAGAGLLVYGVGTAAAFTGAAGPGGDYQPDQVTAYIASGHWVAAFGFWYLGALASLGLLVFGHALRRLGGATGELVWGLAIAGTASSVVGAFVGGGLEVAIAEGGKAIQTGVPHPVIYLVSEIANLLEVCAPAFFAGIIAVILAVKAGLPGWLRGFSVVAGVCGVLAPGFFTLGLFLVWVLVFAGWALARGSRGSKDRGQAAAPSEVSFV